MGLNIFAALGQADCNTVGVENETVDPNWRKKVPNNPKYPHLADIVVDKNTLGAAGHVKGLCGRWVRYYFIVEGSKGPSVGGVSLSFATATPFGSNNVVLEYLPVCVGSQWVVVTHGDHAQLASVAARVRACVVNGKWALVIRTFG